MTKTSVLDVPVEFGGVSIGDMTARLGVKISRKNLTLETADQCFCGHRLQVDVILGRNGDQPGQKTLVDDLDFQVAGAADVKKVSISPDLITTGLTFSLADIDIAELAKFSKGAGQLVVRDVGEIPETPKDKPSEAQTVEGPFRDVPLGDVFAIKFARKLTDFDISTLGEYLDRQTKLGQHWYDDIPGIGKDGSVIMEDQLAGFWKSNPQYAEGQEEAVAE